MSTERSQIVGQAKKFKGDALTNLHQFIDERLLERSYRKLNKNSSPGVDKKYWHNYSAEALWRLPELFGEFKSGSYKAPPIRRVYIRKGKTGKRPLGIPTIEDKILQESVRSVLDPIYEEDFKSFSYGFRSGHSAHQAIDYMFKEVSFSGMRYIIDADIKDYFGSIDHSVMREFLDRRVKDGVVRRMIDKWLKAGILEEGRLSYPTAGTPQGGIISPLLSNIYLHYVLDEWYSDQIQPQLRGKSFLVRYADDFVLGFECLSDAERVMEVLPKRFRKYKLELHPEKTKLISLKEKAQGEDSRGFDFLGFTHYLGRSRKGKQILKRKTSKKKMTAVLERTHDWIKQNRHMKLKNLIKELNMKLRGHYNYYGITFNSRCIELYYVEVVRMLQKWLNRRGGKRVWRWEIFAKLINKWIPLLKPKIYHSQLSTKPI